MREKVVQQVGGVPVVILIAAITIAAYSFWGATILSQEKNGFSEHTTTLTATL